MKKILDKLEAVPYILIPIIFVVFGNGYFGMKNIVLLFMFFCLLRLINILFFKQKTIDFPFVLVLFCCCAYLFLCLGRYPNSNFDTTTSIGQKQQEIYNESGVAVYYNTKVPGNLKIEYLKDYHISEKEAFEYLTKIQKVLSFYSGKKPNKIYLISSFKINGFKAGGFTSFLPDLMVLNITNDIVNNLHHEMGHVISYKTLNIKKLIKINSVKDSCELVSNYACTDSDELFAETWKTAIIENKTTNFSLSLSDLFKDNLTYFKNPNHIDVNAFEENLNKLINKETESFIIKKTDENMLNSLLQQYPLIKEINRLDVGDEILFYDLKED